MAMRIKNTIHQRAMIQHTVSVITHLSEPQTLPPDPALRSNNDDVMKLNNTLINKPFKHFFNIRLNAV